MGGRQGEVQRTYTEADIERALQARAVLTSTRQAAQALDIPERTLAYWLKNGKTAARYQQIRRDIAPKIQEAIASETEDLVLEMAHTRRDMLHRLNNEIDDLPAKDKAAAVKNLAIAESNGIDKALLLRGQPNVIVERRDPEELLRKLKAVGVIDVQHEEIKDANVVTEA